MGARYLGLEDLGSKVKGKTLNRILADHFASVPEAVRDEIARDVVGCETKMDMQRIAGFSEFFADLLQNGWMTAVVTSSRERKMKTVRQKVPEVLQVDGVFTAEMFAESKPAPDPYLFAAKTLCLPVSNCLVFEDSVNGLISGKSAKMKVVGLATTTPAETVSKYADIVIDDFRGFTAEKALSLLRS